MLFFKQKTADGRRIRDWSSDVCSSDLPRGLEDRNDLSIGASLLAPQVRYPDHRHAPEEVYFVLSPGRFQHGASDWFEPGIGGTLYNEPNIEHAMASDDAPPLVLWCLWMGKTPSGRG